MKISSIKIIKALATPLLAMPLISAAAMSEKTAEDNGWEIYRSELGCSLTSEQNGYVLDYSYSPNFMNLNTLKIHNRNWNFTNSETGRIKVLLKDEKNKISTYIVPYEAAYEGDNITIGSLYQTELTQVVFLSYFKQQGFARTELIIDLDKTDDIKFDLIGASNLAEKFADCVSNFDGSRQSTQK